MINHYEATVKIQFHSGPHDVEKLMDLLSEAVDCVEEESAEICVTKMDLDKITPLVSYPECGLCDASFLETEEDLLEMYI